MSCHKAKTLIGLAAIFADCYSTRCPTYLYALQITMFLCRAGALGGNACQLPGQVSDESAEGLDVVSGIPQRAHLCPNT